MIERPVSDECVYFIFLITITQYRFYSHGCSDDQKTKIVRILTEVVVLVVDVVHTSDKVAPDTLMISVVVDTTRCVYRSHCTN